MLLQMNIQNYRNNSLTCKTLAILLKDHCTHGNQQVKVVWVKVLSKYWRFHGISWGIQVFHLGFHVQVNEYPMLLLYPAGDKANPVSPLEIAHLYHLLFWVADLIFNMIPKMHSCLQIKLSTKSSSKDLAGNRKCWRW